VAHPEIADFTPADYDDALALWQVTEGITLRDADSREGIERYLLRNPGLSFTARDAGGLVGTVLCGHDGRRGYLHHLAVAPSHRRQGLGRRLIDRSLAGLRAIGIEKCHLFVVAENHPARDFWRRLGWVEREDIVTMSITLPGSANA